MGDLRQLELRAPRDTDAAQMWRLVRESGSLDLNSPYLYLLICTDFAATSLVATGGDELLGFVAGYRPPSDPAAFFVWQIGVAPQARGRGLAKRMLTATLARDANADARELTATVTPDNAASLALFRSVARDLDVPVRESERFPAAVFPADGPGDAAAHEPEMELRIGPLAAPDADRGDQPPGRTAPDRP